MISARHTTNRQSFKKVTCPFNFLKGYVHYQSLTGFCCEFFIENYLHIYKIAAL